MLTANATLQPTLSHVEQRLDGRGQGAVGPAADTCAGGVLCLPDLQTQAVGGTAGGEGGCFHDGLRREEETSLERRFPGAGAARAGISAPGWELDTSTPSRRRWLIDPLVFLSSHALSPPEHGPLLGGGSSPHDVDT